MSTVIMNYEKLEERLAVAKDTLEGYKDKSEGTINVEIALANRVEELESHMKLQDRNEKLRIKNDRLIKLVTSIRHLLNGKGEN